MKNYYSVTEGSWVELVILQLTDEQTILLKSTADVDKVAKDALILSLNSQREVPVDEAIVTELIAFYTSKKPELKSTDTYQLIGVHITKTNNNTYVGIINCRVNGEHTQVRF